MFESAIYGDHHCAILPIWQDVIWNRELTIGYNDAMQEKTSP
jgi:hypothetical protein